MRRSPPERPVIFSIEAEETLQAVVCLIVLAALTVGAGCGFVVARTIDAVWR